MTPDSAGPLPVAFWLVPTPPHDRDLAVIIDRLASELDAPRFEPHVTVYGGARAADDDIADLLNRASTAVGAIELHVTGVGTSAELFKTLYLEFEADPRADALCRLLRSGLTPRIDYLLRPHLSLLYKHLPEATRVALAKRFDVVGQRITFGQLAAVRPEVTSNNWLDIEKWDAWLRRDLRGR
jgi:hypothetical protein